MLTVGERVEGIDSEEQGRAFWLVGQLCHAAVGDEQMPLMRNREGRDGLTVERQLNLGGLGDNQLELLGRRPTLIDATLESLLGDELAIGAQLNPRRTVRDHVQFKRLACQKGERWQRCGL